jgi:hypothetical protein
MLLVGPTGRKKGITTILISAASIKRQHIIPSEMASRALLATLLRPFTTNSASVVGAELSQPFAQQAVTTSISGAIHTSLAAPFNITQITDSEFRFSAVPSSLGCSGTGISTTIGSAHTPTVFSK